MQQTNWKGRLMAALMVALIGFFVYMSQVEENPVTGERQHVALSPDQEVRLGLESAPAMAREMGGEIPSSDPRSQEVQKIGNYIVNHTEAAKSPWKFQFHLLADSKTVNAFALPGGQVFITLGLFNQLKTQAQLAGVLGHEIGHVIERHSAEQMAKNQLGQALIMAVATGSNQQNQSVLIASVVNQMIQLRYGRQDESEADEWGLKLMEKAGFNPRAMIQVMEVLKAAAGSGHGIELFQSHPNPDLRIEQIKAYLEKHPPPEGLTEGEPLEHSVPQQQQMPSLWDLLR